MRFYWQNLSDAPGHERHGFWHGRCWLRGDDLRLSLNAEWVHGRLGFALSVRFDESERSAQIHVAGLGFSYYVTLEGLPKALFERLPMTVGDRRAWEREVGVRAHSGALWFSLWRDPMCWSAKDPWWMDNNFGIEDVLNRVFGKTKYERRELESREVAIPMPEKSYPATVKRELATWIRPRWPWRPFSKRRIGTSVDIPGGIGMPGKGENDYDIDDDAVYGLSSSESTVEGAIGMVVARVLETRMRRSGHHGWAVTP